jgi:hypothetical protein
LSAFRAVLLRSLVWSEPSITCLVPTLFFARTAPVAANDFPPNAKKGAKSAT